MTSTNGKRGTAKNDELNNLLTEDQQSDLKALLDHPGFDVFDELIEQRESFLTSKLTQMENDIEMYRTQGRISELSLLLKIIRGQLERPSQEDIQRKRNEENSE